MEYIKKASRNRIIAVVIFILVAIFSSIYYYALHLGVAPSGETSNAIYMWAIADYTGKPYPNLSGYLMHIFDYLIYKSVGLNYLAVRLTTVLPHAITLFGCLYVCFFSKKNNRLSYNYLMLPVFVLLAVLVAPWGENGYGVITEVITVFPTDNHDSSVMMSFLSIMILFIIINSNFRNWKKVSKIIMLVGAALFILYGTLKTDVYYLVLFVIPLCISFMLRMFINIKFRKRIIYFLIIAIFMLVALRFLGGSLASFLWYKDEVGIYTGRFYGDIGWISIDNIFDNIEKYIQMILYMFNANFSNKALFSGWSIIYITRIVLAFAGLVIAIKIVVKSFKNEKTNYDIVDEVCAWGTVILSLLFIFGTMSDNVCSYRYGYPIIFFITIILCRNLCSAIKNSRIFANISTGKIHVDKAVFFIFISLVCIGSFRNGFNMSDEDIYETEEREIINYLENNAPNSNVVGGGWLAPKMSAMTEGKYMFFSYESDVKNYLGEDAEVDYIIVVKNGDDFGTTLYEYDLLMEKYGSLVEEINLEKLSLYRIVGD